MKMPKLMRAGAPRISGREGGRVRCPLPVNIAQSLDEFGLRGGAKWRGRGRVGNVARLGKGDLSSGVEWFSRRRCVCGGGEGGNSVAAPFGLRDGLRQSGSAQRARAERP